MKYAMLASGSKGNCCVIESNDVKIVIDCGTTQKYLKASFQEINLEITEVSALLITHNHSDHVKQINMFKNIETYSPSELSCHFNPVVPYETFQIEHLSITALQTSHDAGDSVGYVIDDGEHKLVYITDTGYVRDQDLQLIEDADFYIVESNHDPKLLMETRRPYYIKQRIMSDTGHLSNDDAGLLLSKVVTKKTQSILLAHISGEANEFDLAISTVRSYFSFNSFKLSAAKQYEIILGGNHV